MDEIYLVLSEPWNFEILCWRHPPPPPTHTHYSHGKFIVMSNHCTSSFIMYTYMYHDVPYGRPGLHVLYNNTASLLSLYGVIQTLCAQLAVMKVSPGSVGTHFTHHKDVLSHGRLALVTRRMGYMLISSWVISSNVRLIKAWIADYHLRYNFYDIQVSFIGTIKVYFLVLGHEIKTIIFKK